MANKTVPNLPEQSTKPTAAHELIIDDGTTTKRVDVSVLMEAAPVQSVDGNVGAVTLDYVKKVNGELPDANGEVTLDVSHIKPIAINDVTNLATELAKLGGGPKLKPIDPPTAEVNISTNPPDPGEPDKYYFGAIVDMDAYNSVAGTASGGASKTLISWEWQIPAVTGPTFTSDNIVGHQFPAGTQGQTSISYTIRLTVTDDAMAQGDPYDESGTTNRIITLIPPPLEAPDNQSSQIMLLNANLDPILQAAHAHQAVIQTDTWPDGSTDTWNLIS